MQRPTRPRAISKGPSRAPTIASRTSAHALSIAAKPAMRSTIITAVSTVLVLNLNFNAEYLRRKMGQRMMAGGVLKTK